MKVLYSIIVCLFCLVSKSHAQHNHHHQRNEIGISTGALYATDHKEWGTGLHIHYFRTLGDHSRWAVGAYAEEAWFDNSHFSIGAGGRVEIIERLHFGAFPGVTFTKHDHDSDNHNSKSKFTIHTELVYDLFHWNKFHIGPVIDYSWSKNDAHFMLGVHTAFCF